MPTAIPVNAANGLPVGQPAGRRIDPRGHRFGAGVSAVALIVAFLSGSVWVVPLILLTIGVSAAFGLRYSVYGIAWRRLARALRLGPAEPEHEYPPRFAQTLGSAALVLALLAFALGATPVGWAFTLAVAALQSLLAATGYCLGCRLYFLRWWVPSVVTAIWTRGGSAGPAAASTSVSGGSIDFG